METISPEAGDWALRASRFLREQRPREALPLVERCARQGSGWSLLLRARIKQALGRDDLAIADVTRAFDRDQECSWIFDLPVERLRLPSAPAASRLYAENRGFRDHPGCYPVRAFVGKLKAMAGFGREGLVELNWAIDQNKNQPYLYAWRAELKRRLRDFGGAFSDARKALRLDPRHAVAYATRAALWRARGRPRKALAEAGLALRFGPDYEVGALEGARACYQLGEARDLFVWLHRAVRKAGRYGWRSLSETGAFDESYFDRLLDDPAMESPYWRARVLAWRGEALLGMGRNEPARRCLSAAVKADPRFAWAHGWLGEARRALGDKKEAIRCLDRALRRDGRYARARVFRARLNLENNKLGAALEDADAAVDLEATWAWARFWRARIFMRRHEPKAALNDLDACLRLDTRFAEAFLWRARLRRSQGDPAGFQEDMSRFYLLRGRARLSRAG